MEWGKSPHFMDGAADIWRKILGAKQDLEKVGVKLKIVWVRSHLTAQDVEDGKIAYAYWVGNDKADKTAKLGAAQHAIPVGIEKYYFKELAVAGSIEIVWGGLPGFLVG